jgi:hypothetical protein
MTIFYCAYLNSDWILVSPPSPRNPNPDGIMTCQCDKSYDWSIGVAEGAQTAQVMW